jgi:hypothetical protein
VIGEIRELVVLTTTALTRIPRIALVVPPRAGRIGVIGEIRVLVV